MRKRNLAPVLNANGRAINSSVLITIVFGASLTSIAKYPKLEFIDPQVRLKKIRENRKKVLAWIAAAIVALGVLYLTDCFKFAGLRSPFAKDKAAIESVEAPCGMEAACGQCATVEGTSEAAAPAPAENSVE